jgi:hypothetical protein
VRLNKGKRKKRGGGKVLNARFWIVEELSCGVGRMINEFAFSLFSFEGT